MREVRIQQENLSAVESTTGSSPPGKFPKVSVNLMNNQPDMKRFCGN